MYINLSGFNILVTGASRGLGKAIATKLAEAGATIAVHYNKNMNEAESLAQVLGNESKAFQADLSDPGEAVKLFERVVLELGSIEILINNAGIAILKTLPELTLADYNRQMLVNMTSVFLGTQKAVAVMRETGVKGSIINMSSVAALVGVPACSAYAAAKGGVIGFTKTIAAETAAEGIRCNTIHPGLIDTNMQRRSSVDNPEEYVKLNAAVPMGYMGPPQTIADAALFLVSDLSTYMTGAQMVIDGGLINQ